jgi:hypothetical protein
VSHPIFLAWQSRADSTKQKLTWADNEHLLLIAGFTGLDDPRLKDDPQGEPPDHIVTLEEILTEVNRLPTRPNEETESKARLHDEAYAAVHAAGRCDHPRDVVPPAIWEQLSPCDRRYLENQCNNRR